MHNSVDDGLCATWQEFQTKQKRSKHQKKPTVETGALVLNKAYYHSNDLLDSKLEDVQDMVENVKHVQLLSSVSTLNDHCCNTMYELSQATKMLNKFNTNVRVY